MFLVKHPTSSKSRHLPDMKNVSLHLVGTINDIRASVVTSKMSLADGAKQQHLSNEQEE